MSGILFFIFASCHPLIVTQMNQERQFNEYNDYMRVFIQVLYRMFETFNEIGEEELEVVDVVSGLFSFFVVSIGGTSVGLVYGILTAFMTKFTHHVIIVEPIMVLAMSYASYLTAEMFKLSPILS